MGEDLAGSKLPADTSARLHTPASRDRGLLLVLSGPSGVGKTTLARALVEREEDHPAVRSVSVSTRPARAGEVDGRDYRFVNAARFADLVARGELLEHAEVFGHRYGTPRAFAEARLAEGCDVLLVLDGQGRRQIAARCPNDVVSIFLLPPSLAELRRRLCGRNTDAEESLEARLRAAHSEMAAAREYDYVLVNGGPAETLAALDAIRHEERQRRRRWRRNGKYIYSPQELAGIGRPAA